MHVTWKAALFWICLGGPDQQQQQHQAAHLARPEHHFDDRFCNNSAQESLNGGLRDPGKVARGFKEDSLAVRSFGVHRNCIKPHTGLAGGTPAGRAGTIRGAEQAGDADAERGHAAGRARAERRRIR